MGHYKIMLADDEGIVIDSLKFIIEKEFGELCTIEFAKTGRSVIELAENFRPDIAIMDIQMPGINGIEAMREIRETNQNVVFIVMSAYDKFDYAKEAIKLGVLEYITKPMEKTRIIAALRKAMGQIDRERNKRSNDLMIREKLETVMPIIENGLLYNLLFQEHFTEDIENYKQLLGIDQNYAYILAVVCGETQEGNHMTNAVGSSVKMQQFDVMLREYLKETYPGVILGMAMANKLAGMVPCVEKQMSYEERIALIEKSREIVRELKKRTQISFRIGISAVAPLAEARNSYRAALNAFVMTTGNLAHGDDLPIGCV
ncbi:MAG: response regulator, partial [Lachnospiraceae bacterium]|nr:response regulator [Lachnospiraceae bacterium]